MSDLSYLETVDKPAFEKPRSTGTKMLALVASDDKVLDDNSEDYIEGAKAGGFVIKASNLAIDTPFRAIPVDYKQIYSEFKDNMGDFIGYMTVEDALKQAKDPYAFGKLESKKGTVLQETYSFAVVLPDYDNMVALLNFMSSRVPDGEAWFRKIENMKYGDNIIAPWNQVYKVGTKIKRDTRGSWYLIKPVFDSFVTREEHTMIANMRKNMGKTPIIMLGSSTKDDKDSDY